MHVVVVVIMLVDVWLCRGVGARPETLSGRVSLAITICHSVNIMQLYA